MNPVVHFELPFTDKDRVMAFYSGVFGWKLQAFGPEMGDYVVAITSESDVTPEAHRGAIGGGFYDAASAGEQGLDPVTNIVIAVEDIRAHVGRVRDAGGQVLGDVQSIPGVGDYAVFLDTEGTRVGMLQPEMPEAPAAA